MQGANELRRATVQQTHSSAKKRSRDIAFSSVVHGSEAYQLNDYNMDSGEEELMAHVVSDDEEATHLDQRQCSLINFLDCVLALMSQRQGCQTYTFFELPLCFEGCHYYLTLQGSIIAHSIGKADVKSASLCRS